MIPSPAPSATSTSRGSPVSPSMCLSQTSVTSDGKPPALANDAHAIVAPSAAGLASEAAKPKRIKEKIFNDPVHGHVSIHPACCMVIDTPQFQRLQKLLQLGPSQWAFAGATHKRFAHSIGVSYLAGKFVEDLRQRQPDLNITDVDILCVKLAGLCHDLGHGPLSHTYDGKFVRKARPGIKWDHEWTSAELFEHCLVVNNLKPIMLANWGLDDDDFNFVKELIFGAASEAPPDHVWKGRGIEKAFLYEIVANHRNEIDVDKFDYFKRDCYHLGIPVSFDSDRLMRFSRVIFVEEDVKEGLRHCDFQTGAADKDASASTWLVPQIAYHEKEVWNIYELFHTRFNLHKRAYQHRVAHAVEKMLCDALLHVEKSGLFHLSGTDGAKVSLSHAMEDLEAFTHLNDSIFDTIRFIGRSADTSSELREVLKFPLSLLDRIDSRQLYRHVSEILVPADAEDWVGSEEEILQEILDSSDGAATREMLKDAGAYVDKFSLNYGMKSRNPVDNVLFYRRDNATEGVYKRKEHMSHLAPNKFQEFYVRMYIRSCEQEAHDAAREVFTSWCARKFSDPSPSSMVAPSPGRSTASFGQRRKSTSYSIDTERRKKRARVGDNAVASLSSQMKIERQLV